MPSVADEVLIGDLCDAEFARHACEGQIDEIYQFAADMGGAGYIFTGENDANVMHNSAKINLNIAEYAVRHGVKRFSIRPQRVCTQNITSWIRLTRIMKNRRHIQRLRTPSMGGKSYLVKAMASLFTQSWFASANWAIPQYIWANGTWRVVKKSTRRDVPKGC